jgi:hypothetical protein
MKDVGWIPQVTSSASLLISLTALTFTGLTYRDKRKQDRRDLFLKLHERLVDPELQRGRKLLFTHAGTREAVIALRDEEPEVFDAINRALAMYDIAAMYIAKEYIGKKDFLEEWGPSYGRCWLAAQPFLEVRFGDLPSGGLRGWPHFRQLGPEAAGTLEREHVTAPEDPKAVTPAEEHPEEVA